MPGDLGVREYHNPQRKRIAINVSQLEYIEAIEKRLWSAADNLRANSNYASKEYFLPVVGLVFLRHAYSRYLMIKARTVPCELWFLNRDKPKAYKQWHGVIA